MTSGVQLPVITLPLLVDFPDYTGPDNQKYMVCEREECDGLVPPMRLETPPHTIRHESYCLRCGQRYYFESLGRFEDQNKAFEEFHNRTLQQPRN